VAALTQANTRLVKQLEKKIKKVAGTQGFNQEGTQ
jgi:hypothetical protein